MDQMLSTSLLAHVRRPVVTDAKRSGSERLQRTALICLKHAAGF